MNILVRASLFLMLATGHYTQVSAETPSQERLRDWEFRFYACKHVLINAVFVFQTMEKLRITGEDAINQLQIELDSTLPQLIHENERDYEFTDAEAEFVIDLSFFVVRGFTAFSDKQTDIGLIQAASQNCVVVLDSFLQ